MHDTLLHFVRSLPHKNHVFVAVKFQKHGSNAAPYMIATYWRHHCSILRALSAAGVRRAIASMVRGANASQCQPTMSVAMSRMATVQQRW
jgi:hypothetical protein